MVAVPPRSNRAAGLAVSAGGRWRRVVSVALEGTLLLTVLGTAIFYVVTAFDETRTFNMQLLSGWIAALLVLLTVVAPVRDRIDRIGTPEASDYASFLYGGVILMVMLTVVGVFMAVKKYSDYTLIWPIWLFAIMFFWPEVRYRILTGVWRQT